MKRCLPVILVFKFRLTPSMLAYRITQCQFQTLKNNSHTRGLVPKLHDFIVHQYVYGYIADSIALMWLALYVRCLCYILTYCAFFVVFFLHYKTKSDSFQWRMCYTVRNELDTLKSHNSQTGDDIFNSLNSFLRHNFWQQGVYIGYVSCYCFSLHGCHVFTFPLFSVPFSP